MKKTFYKEIEVNDPDPKKIKYNLYLDKTYIDYISKIEDNINKVIPPKDWLERVFFNRILNKIKKNINIIKITIKDNDKIKSNKEKLKIILKQLNLIKKSSILDFNGWLREWKDAKKSDKTFMINMELRNGMHTHFLTLLKNKYFIYEDGIYIIDDEYKYFDVSSKIYCLDYHQECCLPLKRRFDVKEIIQALESNEAIETETSIDPKSLKIFMESDIIQKVMKGAEMEEWIKFIKLMLIVIAVITSLILILLIKVVFGK